MDKEKIIIYGTGGTAKFFAENDLDTEKLDVLAFCDGNYEKWGGEFLDYPILSPKQLKNIEFDIILVASVFYKEIKKELVEKYYIEENKIRTMYYRQVEGIQQRYQKYYEKRHFVAKNSFSHNIIRDTDKIVIYTAITGDYDDLRAPKFVDSRCKYICFTDNPDIHSDIWEIQLLPTEYEDFNRNAKKIKILPHQYLSDYDWSIWVDGALEIIGDLCQALNTYMLNSHFLSFLHYRRNSVYEEAKNVEKAGFDDIDLIDKQIEKYRNDGFLDDNELIAGGVLFRKHNEADVINVMECWWNEIEKFSRRDQLSFNYCAWKENFLFDLIDENVYENNLVKAYPHKRKKC